MLKWLILLITTLNIYANSFVIESIEIQGLQRIEPRTVLNYLPIKVGDRVQISNTGYIMQKIYDSGFFSDISLNYNKQTLIVQVTEKPVIYEVNIVGDHVFDHDILIKALKGSGLSSGQVFDKSALDGAVLGIKSEYYNRGYYSVEVKDTVKTLSRNRVSINIVINEGSSAKIALIQFVGNTAYSSSQLASLMYLNTGNYLSWWYKDNQYSSEKLNGDLTVIRTFYLNHGFINARINSVQVQLSPDKKFVYITINIIEGTQYKVGTLEIAGNLKHIPKDQVNNFLNIHPGTIVNQLAIDKIAEKIKDFVGNYGYAFAKVAVNTKIKDNNVVDYTFFVDLDRVVYVKHINISGNKKTRDVVIRRELRQVEASMYSTSAIKRSKERLDSLAFLKSSEIKVTPSVDTSNTVDMNVNIVEQDSGKFNFAMGYEQQQGLILSATAEQQNIFGSGKSLSLNAANSVFGYNFSLGVSEPYFLANGTSMGYAIYYNTYTPDKSIPPIALYNTATLGGKIQFGIPFSEFDVLNLSTGIDNQSINLDSQAVPLRFIQFTNVYGNNVNSVPVSISWARNTTNNFILPTAGGIFKQSFSIAVPGIGPSYYQLTSENSFFIPISDYFTWRIKGTFGLINSYDSSIVPFYQNYYLGGINSLRGYMVGTVGPKAPDNSTATGNAVSAIGGTREIALSNEIFFPIPGIDEEHKVRLSLFYDIGTLWGGDPFSLTAGQEMRAGYGIGFIWVSSFLPLKLSYAWPMFITSNDQIQNFQFQLGLSW